MGNKSHFFRQSSGLNLLADYKFNNNLIDDANGYNLTGTDITYNNNSAVFNGKTSEARRSDANDIFSFTDGVSDLPFRIELSVKFNAVSNSYQFITTKRDSISSEWQIFYYNNSISIVLWQNNSIFIQKGCSISPSTSQNYNIIIDYDGNGIDGLNISVDGVDGTIQTETGNYTGMNKTQTDLLIGSFDVVNNYKLDGEIDYLKIYK
mgnify:CR=1 FL=1